MINIGVLRLSPWQWPKAGHGTSKKQIKTTTATTAITTKETHTHTHTLTHKTFGKIVKIAIHTQSKKKAKQKQNIFRALSRKEKNSAFCMNWEIKRNWGSKLSNKKTASIIENMLRCVCYYLFIDQEWSKNKQWNNNKSLELNTFQTRTLILCYDCNRQTKRKLEEENKTNKFFLCRFSKIIWWKIKNEETESILRLHNFLLLSHSSSFVLVCFVYSLETYLKWRIPFDTMI